MHAGRLTRSVVLASTLACLLASPAATSASAPQQGCPPGRPVTLTAELGHGVDDGVELYAVPKGRTLVVTDIVALREGNSDGLLRLYSGERAVGTFALVGIVSATDLYGVHLVTGIPFEGGQTVRARKFERGQAWVTLVGYELASP